MALGSMPVPLTVGGYLVFESSPGLVLQKVKKWFAICTANSDCSLAGQSLTRESLARETILI